MLAFFSSLIPSADMLSGGAQIVVELLKQQKDVKLVLPNRGGWLVLKEFWGKPVVFLNIVFASQKPWLILINYIVLAIKGCFIKTDDDIWCSNDYFCNVIPSFFIKKKTWTVFVFHIIPRKKGRFIAWALQRFSFILMLKKCDRVIVLNDITRKELVNMGFDNDKLFVQPVEIDRKSIESVVVKKKVYDACFMGRMSPSKGIFDLPKIWDGMEGKLIVIGGGGFHKDALKFNEMCQGKNIECVGHKMGTDKYVYMKSAKVFIFPSYEEGLSLTIMEALACGLPVVCWDLPVYNAVYKDKLITVPIGDIEAFREKVKELLCVS